MTIKERVTRVYNDRLEIHQLIVARNKYVSDESRKYDGEAYRKFESERERLFVGVNRFGKSIAYALGVLVPIGFLFFQISLSMRDGFLWYEYLMFFLSVGTYVFGFLACFGSEKYHVLTVWKRFTMAISVLLGAAITIVIGVVVAILVSFLIDLFIAAEITSMILAGIIMLVLGATIGFATGCIALLIGALLGALSHGKKVQLEAVRQQAYAEAQWKTNNLGNSPVVIGYIQNLNAIVARMNEYNPFPERYSTWEDVQAIYEYFRDGRAESMKEAINLRVAEVRTAEYQAKMAEEMRKQTELAQQSANASARALEESKAAKAVVDQILKMTTKEQNESEEFRRNGEEKLREIDNMLSSINSKLY